MLEEVEDPSRRYTNCTGYFQNEWGSQLNAQNADFCFQQVLEAKSGVLSLNPWHAVLDNMGAGTRFPLHVAVHRAYAASKRAVLCALSMLPEEAASVRNVELAEHSPTNPSDKQDAAQKYKVLLLLSVVDF